MKDPKIIAAAHKDIDEFNAIADTAHSETHMDYRKTAFMEMKKQAEPLRTAESAILKSIGELGIQYNDTVRPSYDTMSNLMKTLGDAAHAQANVELQYSLGNIWFAFADCLTALTRFANNYSAKDAETTMQRLQALAPPAERPGTAASDDRRAQNI